MYLTSLPDHSNPGFDEHLHFSRFGRASMIFNARSSAAGCDNHVGCFSLKTVLEGEEWYGIDGRMLAVRPGQFLVLNDMQEYSCRINGGPARTVSVFFKRQMTASVYRGIRLTEDALLDDPFDRGPMPELVQTIRTLDGKTLSALMTMIHSLEREGYDSGRVDEHLIPLLEYCFREHHADLVATQKIHAIKSSTKKEIYKRLCVARDFLNSLYYEKTDLDIVGAASCLSVPQLVRHFKMIFGTTPHKYLVSLRLQRAAETLRTTDKTVQEIAWTCGFENVSAFCRAFKKEYGVNAESLRPNLLSN